MAQVKRFTPPVTGDVKMVDAVRTGLTMGFAQVVGQVPAIVITLRANKEGIKGLARAAYQRSLWVRSCVPGELATLPTVENLRAMIARNGCADMELIGTIEHLEYMCSHPSVVRWNYLDVTANAVDCRASGATKAK